MDPTQRTQTTEVSSTSLRLLCPEPPSRNSAAAGAVARDPAAVPVVNKRGSHNQGRAAVCQYRNLHSVRTRDLSPGPARRDSGQSRSKRKIEDVVYPEAHGLDPPVKGFSEVHLLRVSPNRLLPAVLPAVLFSEVFQKIASGSTRTPGKGLGPWGQDEVEAWLRDLSKRGINCPSDSYCPFFHLLQGSSPGASGLSN